MLFVVVIDSVDETLWSDHSIGLSWRVEMIGLFILTLELFAETFKAAKVYVPTKSNISFPTVSLM